MAENKNKKSLMTKLRPFLPIIGLVLIFIIFDILTGGKMHEVAKLKLLLSQVYVLMIASSGVFFIMTMGGLDFSQGSILGMASLAVCYLSKINMILAVIGGIVVGAAVGAINGYFYVNRKIKSFIVTICTMFLFRGVIKFMTSGAPVSGDLLTMMNLNSSDALKIGLTLVVVLIGLFLFNFTGFGIRLKAIGAGEKAAMFGGIRTDRTKFLIYVLAGAITGFAAFIATIKTGSVTYSAGNQLETQILIALVLGGMPITGGAKASFLNVIVGSLLYTVLSFGLNMLGMTTQTTQLIQGVIFLIFVAIFADRKSLKVIK
ncbi:MAG: ABC transporter permease [Parasporobacterium sp.]|nr:ABC transporter permease [Parasporobacterium sp.]